MDQDIESLVLCPLGRLPFVTSGIGRKVFGFRPESCSDWTGIPSRYAGLLTVTGAAPVRRDKRPCQPTTRGASCLNAPLKKPQNPSIPPDQASR